MSTTSTTSPMAQIVRNTTAIEAFPVSGQRELVTLPSTSTIQDAINILAEAKVLSAPVQDKNGGYLGLVDMFDLLAEVIRAFTEHHQAEEGDVHLNWITWINDTDKLHTRGNILAQLPVTFLINLSQKNPLRFVADKSPLLELLLNFKDHVHRVIMKENNSDHLLRIVSQSDMLQFVRARLGQCDGWRDRQVRNLTQLGGPLVSVTTQARALFAFIQMHTQGVSAVAVVDHQGILVGSISVSDLRSLTPTQLESLQLPVMEYLQQRRPGAPSVPVTCTASASMADVVNLMADARVHRVWVVDEPWKKPIGIMSLTDVMRSFYEFVGGPEASKM